MQNMEAGIINRLTTGHRRSVVAQLAGASGWGMIQVAAHTIRCWGARVLSLRFHVCYSVIFVTRRRRDEFAALVESTLMNAATSRGLLSRKVNKWGRWGWARPSPRLSKPTMRGPLLVIVRFQRSHPPTHSGGNAVEPN